MTTRFGSKTYVLICLIISLTVGLVLPVSAGDFTIVASVEVSTLAMNRFLNTQYNAIDFPRSQIIANAGTNYTIVLVPPQAVVSNNNLKLQMVFEVNSETENLYRFEVNPSLVVPDGQATLSQVNAFVTNLPAELDNIPSLPTWVKNAVIAKYNPIGFIVYPSKLIAKANTSWFKERGIVVKDPSFALGWEVGTDRVTFNVSTFLHTHAPSFSVAYFPGGPDFGPSIRFLSNVEATVARVIILDGIGQTTFWDATPNVWTIKGAQVIIPTPNLGLVNDIPIIVKAIFKVSNTWYARYYGGVPVNARNPNNTFAFFSPQISEN